MSPPAQLADHSQGAHLSIRMSSLPSGPHFWRFLSCDSSCAVLQLIKTGQAQHGCRYGDYQRYRYTAPSRRLAGTVPCSFLENRCYNGQAVRRSPLQRTFVCMFKGILHWASSGLDAGGTVSLDRLAAMASISGHTERWKPTHATNAGLIQAESSCMQPTLEVPKLEAHNLHSPWIGTQQPSACLLPVPARSYSRALPSRLPRL